MKACRTWRWNLLDVVCQAGKDWEMWGVGPVELHEYARLDAVGLRELIWAGEVSTTEVEVVARRALEQADAAVNALTGPLFDPALAQEPGGPLAGVPFVVKDSGPFARGVSFTLGSRSIRGAVAGVDHDMMARFRAAGLVALGQSTAPELGLSFSTESLRYGPTRNPWDWERGVGGSSGGAAALVAAGAMPIAHGNDGAGSIRIPASCCGLVGLKPSRGRTPTVRSSARPGSGRSSSSGSPEPSGIPRTCSTPCPRWLSVTIIWRHRRPARTPRRCTPTPADSGSPSPPPVVRHGGRPAGHRDDGDRGHGAGGDRAYRDRGEPGGRSRRSGRGIDSWRRGDRAGSTPP